ncbi:hypothetical protein QU892_00210, partial [Citrobacter freundii]|uniref:hypothetical protein n=1 Tax=Citrobacter freundii TaxID=546 RepID=UPI0038B91A5B
FVSIYMNNILKMIYMELIGELGAIPLYTSAAFTAPAANRLVTATATNLSFILNNPYNFFLVCFLNHC